MRLGDVRPLELFNGLPDEQLEALVEASEEVAFVPGDILFQEGEPADFWWVMVEGTIDLMRQVGRELNVLGRFDAPGRWAGGFRAWDADGVYLATGRATSDGRMLKVPAEVLRTLVQSYPLAAHLIGGLFHTARNIEAGARQREALVRLGTLSAGLAHELNNPASAATRAADSLHTATEDLLTALGQLAIGGITSDQFSGLDALRLELVPRPRSHDALGDADREDALAAWLGRNDVERSWLMAPPLVAAGADEAWCRRVADLLPAEALDPGLKWVASTALVATLLVQVKDSTRRVSDLVSAVKSYSQMDRASQQRVDVTVGLDTTLLMLGHKLRGGVTVVRSYDDGVPQVDAYPGELNQVWTNLIDNAVDAMDGTGTLSLAVRADGEGVVVEVGDTGHGMPSEVAARAFEAFYTTKDVGKGTGLGLDIARRIIVERHGGTIAFEPVPGGTVVRVWLPVRAPVD